MSQTELSWDLVQQGYDDTSYSISTNEKKHKDQEHRKNEKKRSKQLRQLKDRKKKVKDRIK